MKLQTLHWVDTMFHHATHKVTVLPADLVTFGALATGVLAITPILPAGTVVRYCGVNLVTPFDFSDTGINSCLIEVGDDVDPDRYLTSTQIAVDGTEELYKVAVPATSPSVYLVANTIDITFLIAGGTPLLNETTIGELEVLFWLENRARTKLPKGPL